MAKPAGGASPAVVPRRELAAPTASSPPTAAGSHRTATVPRGTAVVPHLAPGSAHRRPRPALAAPPQILAASVHPSVVGSGTVVSAVVRTTPGVVSVIAYAGGVSIAVPRVGLGLFAGSTTIPPLPPFAHGSYAVTFIASDAHGLRTQSAVGVRVR